MPDPEDPWLVHAREVLAPMVANSRVVTSIYSGGLDPKFAIETGYAILLDKPILLLVTKGATVPKKLSMVADHIITVDDPPDFTSIGPEIAEWINEWLVE